MKSLLISVLFFATTLHAAEKPIVRTMEDKNVKWGPCPEIFPSGCQLGILQGTADKPNADAYLKVPPEYAIPAHTHTSPEHITLVSGNLTVKYKGEEPIALTPGSFLYGPSMAPHEAKCNGSEDCVLFISFDKPIDVQAYKGKL